MQWHLCLLMFLICGHYSIIRNVKKHLNNDRIKQVKSFRFSQLTLSCVFYVNFQKKFFKYLILIICTIWWRLFPNSAVHGSAPVPSIFIVRRPSKKAPAASKVSPDSDQRTQPQPARPLTKVWSVGEMASACTLAWWVWWRPTWTGRREGGVVILFIQ